MSIEEIIAAEVKKAVEPLEREISELSAKLAPLKTLEEYILIRQKDAAGVSQVSGRTITNKITGGELAYVSKDGSKKQYLTLGSVTELRTRLKPKGRKSDRNSP